MVIRSLEELKGSSGTLSGAESQALRTFCTSEYMSPPRDPGLNDPWGSLLAKADLVQFQAYFNSHAQSLSNGQAAAAEELYH